MPSVGGIFFADGGEVPAAPQPLPQFVEDPADTLASAAANQGLLGLLRDSGKPRIQDPEAHDRVLAEAREQHAWRSAPTQEVLPKTTGRRLGNAIADGDYDSAADLLHGTPLSGSAGKESLKAILGRMSGAVLQHPPNALGFRAGTDYLSSAARGDSQIDRRISDVFAPGKMDLDADTDSHTALKDYLEETREKPLELLDAGSGINHYLPAHGAQVSALAGRATNYFNALRPMASQGGPFSEPTPPDQIKQAQYERQVGIAQQPLLALKYAKEGRLQAGDVATLRTLYPALSKKIADGITEQLVKGKKDALPYRARQSLSLLLGQPLETTMQQQTMAAIQAANLGRAPVQNRPKVSKPTAAQMDKFDKEYATPQQARQMDRVSGE